MANASISAGSGVQYEVFTFSDGDVLRFAVDSLDTMVCTRSNSGVNLPFMASTELDFASSRSFATGGTISTTPPIPAAAAAPEPSSLILLGSGALGIAGLIRKRLRLS